MAASNDARHWGGAEFRKLRADDVLTGTFVYGSPWNEAAMLLSAKADIKLTNLSDSDTSECYRTVGGSVRAVQLDSPNNFQSNVQNAIGALTPSMAEYLAHGYCHFAFDSDAPFNKLASIAPKITDSSAYDPSRASDYIEERLAAKFLCNSWYAVL